MNIQKRPEGLADLDRLSGKWTEADAAEFEAAIAPFGQVDWAMWAMEPPDVESVRAG